MSRLNNHSYLLPLTGLFFLLVLASCGKKSTEDQIADLEKKVLNHESSIRKTQGKISDLREEIAILGGDTIAIPDTVYITTVKASRGDFEEFIELPATVDSREVVQVIPEMPGLVTQVKVREGQYVARGTTLLEVDATQLINNLAEIQTALDLAETVYNKRKTLWDQNIGSEIEYLQAKNNFESLEKSKKTLEDQIAKTKVRAPISGSVNNVTVNIGEMAGGMPVMTIVNVSRVQVATEVSEAHIGKVSKGDMVRVTFDGIGFQSDERVTAVGDVLHPKNRTFGLEVEMNNSDRVLKPNMSGTIRIRNTFLEDQVLVPSRLVQSSIAGNYVYVVEGGEAHRIDISIGSSFDGVTVVTEGLEGNEVLIDGGSRDVSESTLVAERTF